MTFHITLWTLAWDTRQGTNCKVFATEKELDSHLAQIMLRARLKIDFHLEIKPIGEVGGVSWR